MGIKTNIIPKFRQVFKGAYDSLPTVGVQVGDLAYATDRKVFYRWSGSAWEAITVHSSSGLAVDIPDAADLPEGSLYYETDTTILKQVQSSAWVAIKPSIPDINVKVKTETRDMTAASGDVSYTGYGFTPVGLIIGSYCSVSGSGIASSGVDKAANGIFLEASLNLIFQAQIVHLYQGASDMQTAIVKSYDADGFTLTWTKSGSPSGTATLRIIAFRS